jgi:hypothetical protein
VVHGYGDAGSGPAEEVDALVGVHRDGVQQDPGAAEVHHGHVDVRVPLGDLRDVVAGQRVTAEVDPAPDVPADPMLQQRAHDRRQQGAHHPAGVDGG